MKAVFLDQASLDQDDLDFTALSALFTELKYFSASSPQQTLERILHAEVVITNKVVIDREMMLQCPQLKLILISATGTDHVDLVQAREQGIVVSNCQGYGTAAVAQHTFALMLALATSLLKYDAAIRRGVWSRSSQFCLLGFPIVELAHKTLGIVGYGTLGQAVAKIAKAFDMKVLVAALPNRLYTDERVAFAELLPQVDFLTLHCPLSEDTRNLLDADAFAAMKRTAFLVNCARGAIVDDAALATALRQGQIAGAAMDVLSIEPPPADHILLTGDIPNLIITPHCAWGSVDARKQIVVQLIENTQAFFQGQALRQVN